MTEVTDDADLQPVVAAEYLRLAGLLDAASDAQWDTASLCAGWRVREVVAHMTMAARYSEEQFMAELRRCGFDFTRLSNEVAARDANLPTAEHIRPAAAIAAPSTTWSFTASTSPSRSVPRALPRTRPSGSSSTT